MTIPIETPKIYISTFELAAATKIAYWQALASGSSVLISENGELVEVFPDGTRKFVQKIDPYIKANKRKFVIKK